MNKLNFHHPIKGILEPEIYNFYMKKFNKLPHYDTLKEYNDYFFENADKEYKKIFFQRYHKRHFM